LSFEIGNYLGTDPERRRAFEAKAVLDSLFPPDDEFADQRQVRIGDSWVFVHYGALHPPASDSAQYVVRAASDPLPAGMHHLTSLGAAALYARDTALWHWQRSHPPPPYSTNAIYTVPRAMQSQQLGRPEEVAQIDLRHVIARWRRRG
jgi:hypothetical protein